MAYLRKSDVLSSIKNREQCVHGIEYTIFEAYLGTSPLTKKPIRISARSIEKLKKKVADFYQRLSSGGDACILLTPYQSLDAKAALDLLIEAKSNMTLTECARLALSAGEKQFVCATTMTEAWKLYAPVLKAKSLSYQRSFTSHLTRWIAAFGGERLLSEVTAAELKKYLMEYVYRASDPKTAKTYNNVLGDIKTFIHWCCSKEQGFLAGDPLDGMKKMEIGYRQPEYMKAVDVEKLFRVLEKRGGADLSDAILSFFCGMRTVEIERVREGESAVKISLEDHFIRVIKCKGSLRGVRPRAFKIPEQAEAWMRSFDFMSAVHTPNPSFRQHLIECAAEAKVELPKNAGRHTFITMYEAAHHDANALSAIVGNTESVRSRSYNGVELEREGKAYFAILPSE